MIWAKQMGWAVWLLAITAGTLVAEEPGAIRFQRDIRPILKKHCYACHSDIKQSGELRLDFRQFAEQGGNSKQPILGGGLEGNEIYQRIVSADPQHRMPWGKPPLSLEEVGLLTQWVQEDTPWPEKADEEYTAEVARENGFGDESWGTLLRTFFVRSLPWLVLLALWAGLVWWMERRKKQVLREPERLWSPRCQRMHQRLFRTQGVHYALITMLLISGGVALNYWRDTQRWRQERLSLREACNLLPTRISATQYQKLTSLDIYGNPPVPHRPPHPRRLHGQYYRGNNERDIRLSNLGNYRTATLHLDLVNARDEVVNFGDDVSGQQLFVRLEIERAPYASQQLFTERIMSTIYLSRHFVKDDEVVPASADDRVGLRSTHPSWRWAVHYPVAKIEPGQSVDLSRLVYLYISRSAAWEGGVVHYGIQYDLKIEKGRVQNGSDLWMGSLYWNPKMALPQPGKVPSKEWFDHYPIPELTQGNTTDPDLIGVQEYLQQQREPAAVPPSAN